MAIDKESFKPQEGIYQDGGWIDSEEGRAFIWKGIEQIKPWEAGDILVLWSMERKPISKIKRLLGLKEKDTRRLLIKARNQMRDYLVQSGRDSFGG